MFATLLLFCSAPPAAPAPLTEPEANALVAQLTNDLGAVSSAALQKLVAAGPGAKAALPALLKLMADGHPKQLDARYDAAQVVGAIGPAAKEALPELLKLLERVGSGGASAESVAVAIAAVDAHKPECTRALLMSVAKGYGIQLEESALLKSHPAEVVRDLCALCADKDPIVRSRAAAVLALGRHQPDPKQPQPVLFERAGAAAKAVPAVLEKLLADPDPCVRSSAAYAAASAVPDLADKAVTVMIELAKSGDRWDSLRVWGPLTGRTDAPLRYFPAHAFAHAPERALAQLVPLFESANPKLSAWAVWQAADMPVRDKLEALLKDAKSAGQRAGAARALGLKHRASVPVLTTALKDPAREVRFAAAEALVALGETAEARAAGVPALTEGLSAADAGTRVRACELLQKLRADAKSAVPDLKKLLDDPARGAQLPAALALADIDPKSAAGAVPVLVAGLRGTEADAPRAAAALGALGPLAKDAVPALVEQFEAKRAQSRIAAADAVPRIDATRAPDAVKALLSVVNKIDRNYSHVQSSALRALAQMTPRAKAALPELEPLLTVDGYSCSAEVAVTMLLIDPNSEPALTWVRKKFASRSYDAQLHLALEAAPAVYALFVPDFLAMLEEEDWERRAAACRKLGACGPLAKAALPKLKERARRDAYLSVRESAQKAIERIEGK